MQFLITHMCDPSQFSIIKPKNVVNQTKLNK